MPTKMKTKTGPVTRSKQVASRLEALCIGVSKEQYAATVHAVYEHCDNLLTEIAEELEIEKFELQYIEEDEE